MLSPTDAQALIDSASRRCLIDGVEKISKYQLQTPPYPDLIRVMQRHPSHPSIDGRMWTSSQDLDDHRRLCEKWSRTDGSLELPRPRRPHPASPPAKAEWVFTTTSGIPYKSVRGFNAACKAADLKGMTPHSLRHTFASRLMGNGVDPMMATKLAGGSSIKMLDRYHADPSRIAEAVEGPSR